MGLTRRAIAAAALALGPLPARADESRVRVWSTTDRPVAQALIDDFSARHPGLSVDYVQLGSSELYERARAAGSAGGDGTVADVLWSSAMDLQIKLANDGHAARYVSVHASRLPRWAIWKHEAYGTGYEPVGVVIRRELLDAPGGWPRTHAGLAALLQAQAARFRGRVATYDIERAGLGYLLVAQDLIANHRHWELLQALGRCQASLHADTQSMLDRVAGGDALLAYNVLGSYAEAFVRQRPQLAVLYFDDYALVASRVALITRAAAHPQAARLWLDHLLSIEGQRVLARAGGSLPVRTDAQDVATMPAPRLGAAFRPITLGPGLLAHLDQSKREALLRRWQRVFTRA